MCINTQYNFYDKNHYFGFPCHFQVSILQFCTPDNQKLIFSQCHHYQTICNSLYTFNTFIYIVTFIISCNIFTKNKELRILQNSVLHFLNSVYTHISPKVYHFYHTCVYARVCEREGYKIPRIKKPTHLSKRWLKYVITVGCLGATLKLRLNFPSENFLKSQDKKKSIQSSIDVSVLLFSFSTMTQSIMNSIPSSQTVNTEYYLEVSHCLWEKKGQNWRTYNSLIFPACTSLVIGMFLTKNNIIVIPQLPYSPDMAPCDFWQK